MNYFSSDAVLVHRKGIFEDVVDVMKDTDSVYIVTSVGWGSTIQYMKEEAGWVDVLEPAMDKLWAKMEIQRTNSARGVMQLLRGVDSLHEKKEGTLRLIFSYNSFQSNIPEDPVEYDEEYEFVCFFDTLMSNVEGLVNTLKGKYNG